MKLTHTKVAGVVLAVVLVAGAGYSASRAKAGERTAVIVRDHGRTSTVEPGVDRVAKVVITALFGRTESDEGQAPFVTQRAVNLAAAAIPLRADVEAYAINGTTEVSNRALVKMSFGGRCTGVQNDQCDPGPELASSFVSQLIATFGRIPPAATTDIPGALALIARRRAELARTSPKTRLIAVLIGDGVSTTSTCDFGLMPLEPPFDDAVDRCLGAVRRPDLRGTTVYLVGTGTSPNVDPAAVEVLRAAPAVDAALIRAANGHPVLLDLDAGPAGLR